MMHTGDEYETRARLARHHELRRLSSALAGLVFGRQAPARPRVKTLTESANTQMRQTCRAA